MEPLEQYLKKWREGLVEFYAPDPEKYRRPDGVYEPAWAPVFYNPLMKSNRDIAVLVARVLFKKQPVIVEPLTATGVRALRYSVEANAIVYASDINELAIRIAKRNAALNNVEDKVSFHHRDANSFMYSLYEEGLKPDLVDIDPFGSPAPYIVSALSLLRGRGVLAVTATDTAVLAGVYPKKLLRRYSVLSQSVPWEKELAARTLASYVIRRAAEQDYAATPLLVYYADYYVRAYFKIEKGARKADKLVEELAYAYTCRHCYYTWYDSFKGKEYKCPYCQGQALASGPIYKGSLCSSELIGRLIDETKKAEWLAEKKNKKLLETLREECSLYRPYFRIDKLCSWLHLNMPKKEQIIKTLRSQGFKAIQTHFEPRGIKTNAPYPLIVKTLYNLSYREDDESVD